MLLALSVALTATAARPCAFHTYAPQPTMIDRLLNSEHIVLARAAADNPFRYQAVRALSGNVDHVEIPQLLDATTGRKLAENAEAYVLFARDGAYGPWERLAFVDSAMASVLGDVNARLPEWQLGDYADRFSFFASVVDHPDARIHQLALQELDQASYPVLRNLDLDPDVARISRNLQLVSEADLRPIRILLLGLSGASDIAPYLAAGVQASVRSSGTSLGPFATAYVEAAGPSAAFDLINRYLTDASLPTDSRESIVEALAIHLTGGALQSDQTVTGKLGAMVSADPSLAPSIARQFGARRNWSQQHVLKAILKTRVLSLSDTIVVSHYIALAGEDAQPSN